MDKNMSCFFDLYVILFVQDVVKNIHMHFAIFSAGTKVNYIYILAFNHPTPVDQIPSVTKPYRDDQTQGHQWLAGRAAATFSCPTPGVGDMTVDNILEPQGQPCINNSCFNWMMNQIFT